VSDLPPYARLLKLARVEGGEGAAPRFAMPFDADVMGRPGYLHGGAIAGLLEFAAFAAVRQALGDASVAMKPVTVTVDYLRGANEARGESFAEAKVERLGGRIANVEAVAWQTDRARPIATARINFVLER
jgi:uncharacterized protein (TIGR00369 family)